MKPGELQQTSPYALEWTILTTVFGFHRPTQGHDFHEDKAALDELVTRLKKKRGVTRIVWYQRMEDSKLHAIGHWLRDGSEISVGDRVRYYSKDSLVDHFNGLIGRVTRIDEKDDTVWVEWDTRGVGEDPCWVEIDRVTRSA